MTSSHLLRITTLGFLLGVAVVARPLPAADTVHTADRGTIVFAADKAMLTGADMKLEKPTDGAVVSGWKEPGDAVRWELKPARWGRYDIELQYAAAGAGATDVQVEVAGQVLTVRRPSTGGADRWERLKVGRFYLAKSEPFSIQVRCSPAGPASGMSLRSLTLKPAPEGESVTQAADAVITLRSAEATTYSEMMRFEPATNKNCLGYWVNPADWADWTFTVNRPGTYDVEVWQGCGRDQGGSEVNVETGGVTLPFTVEETGHFQNFVPRRVGRVTFSSAGPQTLAIKPQNKKAAAVMDIRRIRLVPTTTAAIPSPAARAFVAAPRVVILGDSITYGGEWPEWVETWLHLQFPEARVEFVNLGLPSETASGLSEAGHAGGSFPRPDVNERLGRVLEKTHPDLIVACYGMNDGIYFPLGEERFKKFQEGIIRLRETAAHQGVRVIHLTPPIFDPVPLTGRTLPAGRDAYPSPYEGYNTVLDRYSEWLLSRRTAGWEVVDVHGPMNSFLAEQRKLNPKFELSNDGVHANSQGHWLMARELLRHLGAPEVVVAADVPTALMKSDPRAVAVFALVQKRQRLLKDSWLTAVGHQRPGMSKGIPLADAERQAAEIATQLATPR
jgi:lysophospholipase L1-like esterase